MLLVQAKRKVYHYFRREKSDLGKKYLLFARDLELRLRSVTNFRFNLSISQITKCIEKIFVTNEPIKHEPFYFGEDKMND